MFANDDNQCFFFFFSGEQQNNFKSINTYYIYIRTYEYDQKVHLKLKYTIRLKSCGKLANKYIYFFCNS